ncbi:phosphoadenosine phosphosulfate reductase family protein [Sphingobium yanoikuyae]|uniref:phosphoadenosine phosphosulfate reductase domain-containing protein n=1 Tax=Sphingobium yanoikuyae TaxID=13690 RepID=UPI001F37EFBB|nr:phosphoadenosine phosphosulfate reductase family protein [Sphingobium yanoikuyae]
MPAIDDTVLAAVRRGAWFAFNLSGGKDSTASAHAAIALLDALGHPRHRRIAIHADLGRAEWRSTPAMVAAIADRLGIPLLVVSRSAGDMVARWEQRFLSGKRRYEALETYNLIGPWSSASLRFCTSELKVQVIGPELARRYRGETIVSVIGLRRDESPSRRSTPISRSDERFAKPGNAAGTNMLNWHPAVDWSADDVFGIHERHGLPLHEAYVRYRTTRLSCAFCVLGSAHDLAASAEAPGNLDLYRHLVAIELDSTFSFQPQRWLADVAPQLLSAARLREVARVKVRSHERRTLEAAMPPELRYVKGWPPRMPSLAEAALIAKARAPILAHHGLADHFPDAAAVQARFAHLLAIKAERTR